MKNTITTLLFFLAFITGYSQNLGYQVHGNYSRPITKEKLSAALTMNDISPGYPSSWITNYISAEVSATINGKVMKGLGKNDILSPEQKNILHQAELGTDVVVDIQYRYPNSVTNNMDLRGMHFEVTVVPEIEAEFIGGQAQLTQYLKENAINKISEADSKQMKQAIVSFTINEKGSIANAQISTTSGDPEIDKLLLKAITKMPKWKPAENAMCIKVKQDFQFSVGNDGC